MLINSLWPGDAMWRHGTRSTLDQVMACCLTAPSHYLNQCWLIIGGVPWHSLDDVKIPINKTRLKIAVLKWHLGLPGANELKYWSRVTHASVEYRPSLVEIKACCLFSAKPLSQPVIVNWTLWNISVKFQSNHNNFHTGKWIWIWIMPTFFLGLGM